MNRFPVHVCFVASLFAYGSWAHADENTYPHSFLLVEPQMLARPEIAAGFVILDCRSRAKYQSGHAPNALWVDADAWAKSFGHGQNGEDWSRRITALGVGWRSKVVVYDDVLSKDAARIWWILRYWGVLDVKLLNGGWKAWNDGNNPTQTQEVPTQSVRPFFPEPQRQRLVGRQQLMKSLPRSELQIVDARSHREFCGIEPLHNKRAGAIPGSLQLEWVDLLDKKTQRFKPETELRRLFASAGVALERPTATYCQSGDRASLMAFALELMGNREISNYYPGWAEWGNSEDTFVVPGKPRPRSANIIADWNEAIRRDPNQADAYVGRGSAWLDQKEYDMAISDYNGAIQLDPKSGTAYGLRGSAWWAKEEYSRAVYDYVEAIRFDPKHAFDSIHRGDVWREKEDYDKALHNYDLAAGMQDPELAIITTVIHSPLLSRKRDFDEAIAEQTEAIRRVPKNVKAYIIRARFFTSQTEYDKALADWNAAI
ncbi:MAG TPA: rhodanese-like domain-containing protein, partial [Planctomycetaceae bacterium]|nr:rhodanese-like domain-containing protein [Planctomycetaceae bacterium]